MQAEVMNLNHQCIRLFLYFAHLLAMCADVSKRCPKDILNKSEHSVLLY